MKLTITTFILCIAVFCLQANQTGEDNPIFKQSSSFDKLCTQAKYESKPVLLLISSKKCASFRNFKNKVLSDSSILDLYTRNFLCYNVDVDSREGKKLASQYNAMVLPAIIYLSPTKDVIFRSNGTDKVTAAASEAIRVLKVMQAHNQVKRQALRAQSLSIFNRKYQKKIAIEYAKKDAKAGKTDIEKQAFEYTLNNSELRRFRKTYIKTMQTYN